MVMESDKPTNEVGWIGFFDSLAAWTINFFLNDSLNNTYTLHN